MKRTPETPTKSQETPSKPLLSQSSLKPKYDGNEVGREDTVTPASEQAPDRGGKAASRIFPIEPFAFCSCMPEWVMALLPAHFKRIQCLPHLMLILGVVTSLFLLVDTIAGWYAHGCRTSYCQGRIIPIMFVSCCLMYFLRTIEQYDEDLLVKQRELQKAKEEMAKHYHDTVVELDECIAKSMDTQATLAERTFDAKRRDFQRFLMKVVKDFKHGAVAANDASLQVFQSFVSLWLQIFSECSMDPLNQPLLIVSSEEMSQFGTIPKTAEIVAERLKSTQVKFISKQLDKDKEDLYSFRSVWHNLTKSHATTNSSKRKSLVTQSKTFHDQEAGESSIVRTVTETDPMSRRWFQPGRASKCCGVVTENADETGYPVELHCICCKCVLLSQEHLQLFAAFCFGWMILYIEWFIVDVAKYILEINVGVCLVCIVFVLHEFVDIDIVQQLEMQLKDVQMEHEKLEQKRKAILDFYDTAQLLADVWLHRTVPRLELLKQFSEEVEDRMKDDYVAFLSDANSRLEMLEKRIPAMALWFAEDTMDAKTRTLLGDAMTELTRARDIKAALKMIPECSKRLALENERLLKAAQPKSSVKAA